MTSTNFYHDKTPNKEKQTIFLYFRYDKNTLKISTGLKVNPTYWDRAKKQVQETPAYPAYGHINPLLERIAWAIEAIYYRQIAYKTVVVDNTLLRGKMKERLKSYFQQVISMEGFIERFIDESKQEKEKATIRNYENAYMHLRGFAKSVSPKEADFFFDFKNINEQWLNDFIIYLNKKGFSHGHIHGIIKYLRVFLKAAYEMKFINVETHKKDFFKVKRAVAQYIYLTPEEIKAIEILDLEDVRSLINARDIFLLLYYAGLSYDDYLKLKRGKVNEDDLLYLIQQHKYFGSEHAKTVIENIVKKHNGFPKPMHRQHLNVYLKKLGEKAAINTEVSARQVIGKENKPQFDGEQQAKHKLISAKTALFSFAMNHQKNKVPDVAIMQFTKHTKLSDFKRYTNQIKKA